MLDSHCHLNMLPLANDLDGVLARAKNRDVTGFVIPAYDHASWTDILEMASRTGLYPALGIHPWVAHSISSHQLKDVLAKAITDNSGKVVAIGEIGLDTKVESPPLEVQLEVFNAQLELAVDMDLPVILHCRGAFHELLDAVNKHQGAVRGVIHAFTRGPELVQRFHQAGLFFGVGGAVTRENARRVHKGAKVIPSNRLLIETDAPSIGLQGVRPEETEPHHVADVAAALAQLRGVDGDEIAKITTENARQLFGLPGS